MGEKALSLKEAVYGERHARVAEALGNLGNAFMGLGRYSQQQGLLERALEIQRLPSSQASATEVAVTLSQLGVCYGCQKDHARQCEFLEEALDVFQREDPQGIHLADVLVNL